MQAGDRKKQQLWAVASIDREVLQLLAARLERAVDTLQRLPAGTATQPAGTRSAWPEMIRKSRFIVERTRQESRSPPSAEAIDDLDRLAMLLWKLTPRHRQLLWARACRIRWAELCRRQRRSRTTLARDHRLALMALAMAEREAAMPPSRRTGFRSGLRSSACLNRYGDGTTPTTLPFVPSEAAKISLNVCIR